MMNLLPINFIKSDIYDVLLKNRSIVNELFVTFLLPHVQQ